MQRRIGYGSGGLIWGGLHTQNSDINVVAARLPEICDRAPVIVSSFEQVRSFLFWAFLRWYLLLSAQALLARRLSPACPVGLGCFVPSLCQLSLPLDAASSILLCGIFVGSSVCLAFTTSWLISSGPNSRTWHPTFLFSGLLIHPCFAIFLPSQSRREALGAPSGRGCFRSEVSGQFSSLLDAGIILTKSAFELEIRHNLSNLVAERVFLIWNGSMG